MAVRPSDRSEHQRAARRHRLAIEVGDLAVTQPHSALLRALAALEPEALLTLRSALLAAPHPTRRTNA